ncbi:unnamed protein product [Rangifer tarandus platyrhynchus]|uniref:Uncharacterized protein n=1 Tax=Rangifer tarandus platyrhynchus TaxID=3082113 RepID=A0ABN8XIB4_RANTA|nr:unnamed protein product [Rangifer tarandus platyrhynchus]
MYIQSAHWLMRRKSWMREVLLGPEENNRLRVNAEAGVGNHCALDLKKQRRRRNSVARGWEADIAEPPQRGRGGRARTLLAFGGTSILSGETYAVTPAWDTRVHIVKVMLETPQGVQATSTGPVRSGCAKASPRLQRFSGVQDVDNPAFVSTSVRRKSLGGNELCKLDPATSDVLCGFTGRLVTHRVPLYHFSSVTQLCGWARPRCPERKAPDHGGSHA